MCQSFGYEPVVILALFYHDVIYDVNRKDNEEASARAWVDYARKHGADSRTTALVSDLILMTAKHRVEEDGRSQEDLKLFKIMSDADMSVFLSSSETYFEYAQSIWKEYHSFGREKFIAGRLQFLSTVEPESLFYTEKAVDLLHVARRNLTQERALLENDPDQITVALD